MGQQEIQFKAIPGQFNIDEAQGVVECFVAGIGNKDSVGDVLITGAFSKSLTRRKPRVVWGHNWNDPIGKVLEIYEVAPGDRRLPTKMLSAGIGGLYAKVQFNLNSEKGREAFANVAFFGQEQEWSIGYKTLDSIFDPNIQANILKEVELYEVSPVLHGANQLTGTISVKSDETAEKHMPGMMMPHQEGMGTGPKIIVVRQDDDDDDDDRPIFSEGLAQALGDNEKERLTRELQARSGSLIQLVSATESTAKFRRMTSDGRSVMYRIGYHTPDNYVTFMFGKPELAEGQQSGGSRTVTPSQMPSMPMQVKPQVTTQSTNFVVNPEYVMPKGQDYEKSAFDEELENLAQILDETFDVKVGRTLSSRNMSKLKTVLETLQDIVSSAEKDIESKNNYIIPVHIENAFETKQLLDPIFDYHRVESYVTEDGIVITTGVTQEFIEAIGVAEKALGRTLSGGPGKLGRAVRGAVNFDPKAWDGDGDGIVQEGTPYSRPAIPGVNDRASGGRVDLNAATRAWQNQRRAGMASRTGRRMDADDNFDEYDEAMGPPMRRPGRGMPDDPVGEAASENIDRDRNAGAVRSGLASRTSINESSNGQRIVPSRMHSDDREMLAEVTDPEERKKKIDDLIEFYGRKIFAKPSKPRKKSTAYKKDEDYIDLDDNDKEIVDAIQEAIENGDITGESLWSDWVSNTLGDWSQEEQYEAIYGRPASSEDFQESADQSGSKYRDGEGRGDDDIEEEFYSESIADASPREKLRGLVGEYIPKGSTYGDDAHIAALRQSFSSESSSGKKPTGKKLVVNSLGEEVSLAERLKEIEEFSTMDLDNEVYEYLTNTREGDDAGWDYLEGNHGINKADYKERGGDERGKSTYDIRQAITDSMSEDEQRKFLKTIAELDANEDAGRSGLSSSTSGSRGKPEPLKREGEFHGGNIYDEFHGQYVEGEVVALSDLYGDDRPGYGIVGRYDTDGDNVTIDYFYGGTDNEEFETIEDAMAFLENVENEAENDRFYNDESFRSLDRVRSAGRPGKKPLAGLASSTTPLRRDLISAEIVSDLPENLVNDIGNAAVRAVGRSGDETRLIDGAKEVLANLTNEKLKDSVGKSVSNARKRLAELLSDEKVIEEFQSKEAIEDFMDEVNYAVQKMLDLHVGSVKKTGTSVEKEEIEEIVDNAKSKFDNDFNKLIKASKEYWSTRRRPGRLDSTPEEAKKESSIDRKNLMMALREGGEPEDLESTLGSISKIFGDRSEGIISGTISLEDLNYEIEKAIEKIVENDPSIDPEDLINELADALRKGASKDGANPLIVALAKEFGDEKITGGDLLDSLNDTRKNSVYRPDRGKIEKENIRGFASRVGNSDGSSKREMDMTLAEYAELDEVLKKYMDDSQLDGIGADEDMQVIQNILDKLDLSSAANDSIPLTDKEIDDYMDTLTRMRDNGPVEDLADKESIDKLIDSLKKTKDSKDGIYESDALQQAGTRLSRPSRDGQGGGRGRTAKGTRPFKSSDGTINPHKKLDIELDDSEIGQLRDELDGFMKMTNNPGPLRAIAEKLEKATNGKFSVEKDEYEEVIKEIEKLRRDKKIVTSDVIGVLEQAAESKKGKYSSIDVRGGRGFSSSTGGRGNNGAPSDIPETMQKQLIMWGRQQRGLRLVQEAIEKFDKDGGTLPASYWRRLRTMHENMGPGSASGAARRGGRRGIFGRGKDTDASPRGAAGFIIDDKPVTNDLLDNTMSNNPIVTDGFTDMRSGSMGGSQGGGVFKDPKTGKEYYVKPSPSQTHAENESLMSRFYQRLGIPAVKGRIGTYKGKPKYVSEMVPGAVKVDHEIEMKNPAWKKAVQDTFVANAWLANWDAVSNGGNTVRGGDGNAYVIDVGGAGLFRAKGEPKGSRFGPIVGEMESLRDPKQDGARRGVAYWGDIPPAEIARQVKAIGAISDSEIKQMVDAVISDKGEAKKLSDTLIARRDYLVQNWSTGKNSGTGRRGRTGFSSSSDGYEGRNKRPGMSPGMRPADFEVRADSDGITGVGKGGAMGTKPDLKFTGDSFDKVKPEKWEELTIDEKWEWMLGEGSPEKGGTMSPAAFEGAMKKLGEEEAKEELKRMSPEERRKARSESRETEINELSDNEKQRLTTERDERKKQAEASSKRVKEEATAEDAKAKRQTLLDGFNEWIDDSARQLAETEYDETDINPDAEDIWDTVSTILGVDDITPKSLNEAIDELSSYVDITSGENASEKKNIARANALLKKLSKMKSEYSEDKWFNGGQGRRSGFESTTGGRPRPGTPEMPQSNAKREGDVKKLSALIEKVVAELEAKRQNPSPKKGRMGFSSSTGKTMITDEATFFRDVENSLAKEIRAAQKAKNAKAITGLTKLQEIIKRNEASKIGDRRTNVGSIYMTMDEVDLILDGLQFALDQQMDAGGDKRIGWYSKLIEKIAAAAMSTFIDKTTTEIGSTRRTVINKDGVKKKINIVPEP